MGGRGRPIRAGAAARDVRRPRECRAAAGRRPACRRGSVARDDRARPPAGGAAAAARGARSRLVGSAGVLGRPAPWSPDAPEANDADRAVATSRPTPGRACRSRRGSWPRRIRPRATPWFSRRSATGQRCRRPSPATTSSGWRWLVCRHPMGGATCSPSVSRQPTGAPAWQRDCWRQARPIGPRSRSPNETHSNPSTARCDARLPCACSNVLALQFHPRAGRRTRPIRRPWWQSGAGRPQHDPSLEIAEARTAISERARAGANRGPTGPRLPRLDRGGARSRRQL